jgi:hypothetical protein|tara:strand:- start:305 stop:499 length:195 start_codon:yes stop_codon:yes gene_type:complete
MASRVFSAFSFVSFASSFLFGEEFPELLGLLGLLGLFELLELLEDIHVATLRSPKLHVVCPDKS